MPKEVWIGSQLQGSACPHMHHKTAMYCLFSSCLYTAMYCLVVLDMPLPKLATTKLRQTGRCLHQELTNMAVMITPCHRKKHMTIVYPEARC